jgi:hypothetical protein
MGKQASARKWARLPLVVRRDRIDTPALGAKQQSVLVLSGASTTRSGVIAEHRVTKSGRLPKAFRRLVFGGVR